jgi:hypothetical protein
MPSVVMRSYLWHVTSAHSSTFHKKDICYATPSLAVLRCGVRVNVIDATTWMGDTLMTALTSSLLKSTVPSAGGFELAHVIPAQIRTFRATNKIDQPSPAAS